MYLKSDNVNIENEGATGKILWVFRKMDGEWTDLPQINIPPSPSEIKNILTSPKNQKIQNSNTPPYLNRGHTMGIPVHDGRCGGPVSPNCPNNWEPVKKV